MKGVLLMFFIGCFALVTAQSPWQQQVDYSISVELNPTDHTLSGQVIIDYTNNSPNSLQELYIHLWPNAYTTNESAFSKQLLTTGNKEFYLAEKTNPISNLDFRVDGISTQFSPFENATDIAVLQLNEAILPGTSVQIESPFFIELPNLWSRFGVKDSIVHLTQWFPKIAMYDETGWQPMPYLHWGEYYSNFGNYELELTLPANYVVAATGALQTEEEKNWLSEIANATQNGLSNNYNFSQATTIKNRTGTKTIRYQQANVHDFALFTSPDFLVLEQEVNLPKKTVQLQSFFPAEDVFMWEQANAHLTKAMQFYSEKIGEYPYENYKAVGANLSAGAGMEYPMIAVHETPISDLSFKQILVHELGHSWFQGLLANNEREHAWLDESLTSFYTDLYLAEEVGVQQFPVESYANALQFKAANQSLQPIQQPANQFHYSEYGQSVYQLGTLAMNYLREYVGEETFETGIQRYFNQFQFSHPKPSNLQAAFETDKNLDWFFDDLLHTNHVLDYKLKANKNEKLVIANRSNLAFPFTIDLLNEKDSIIHTQWVEGFLGEKEIDFSTVSGTSEATIFARPVYFETNRANNSISIRKNGKPSVEIVTPFTHKLKEGFGNINQKQLFATPLVGYNGYDGFQLGGLLTNSSILEKLFEFQILPLYAFDTEDVTGLAEIRAKFYPTTNSAIRKIEPYNRAKHFHFLNNRYELDYFQNQLGVTLHFAHQGDQPNSIDKQLDANWVLNRVEQYPNLSLPEPQSGEYENEQFLNLEYTRSNLRKINPNEAKVTVQANEDFLRLSGEYNYRYDFAKQGEYAKLRFFGGGIFSSSEAPFQANFSAIGRSGQNDYDFSNLYFYRGDESSFLNQAWTEADGGLKAMENYAFASDYYGDKMAAINAEVTLPVGLPIGKFLAFSDVALFTKTLGLEESESSVLYDAGISYQFADLVKIYYPVLLSDEFKPSTDIEEFGFQDKLVISFQFNPLDIKQRLRSKMR